MYSFHSEVERAAQQEYVRLEQEGKAPFSRADFDEYLYNSHAKLIVLNNALKLRAPKTLAILDLGCGVALDGHEPNYVEGKPVHTLRRPTWTPKTGPVGYHPGNYHFWPGFGTILHLAGHSVLGIDWHPEVHKALFPTLCRDLYSPGSLKDVCGPFDVITAFNLIDNPCPTLNAAYGINAAACLDRMVAVESQRLVRPGGILLLGLGRPPTVL